MHDHQLKLSSYGFSIVIFTTFSVSIKGFYFEDHGILIFWQLAMDPL
jgi:hypothetical protein